MSNDETMTWITQIEDRGHICGRRLKPLTSGYDFRHPVHGNVKNDEAGLYINPFTDHALHRPYKQRLAHQIMALCTTVDNVSSQAFRLKL